MYLAYAAAAFLALAAITGAVYEFRIRRAHASATAAGFLLLPLATTLGSVVLNMAFGAAREAASAASAVTVAAIGAVPGILTAVAGSPLLAFLFAVTLSAPASYVLGAASQHGEVRAARASLADAVSKANSRADTAIANAVAAANKRADDAIAKARAEYDAKVKSAKTAAAAPAGKKAR